MDNEMVFAIQKRAAWLRARLDALPGLDEPHPGVRSDWIARRTRRMQALDALIAEIIAYPDRPTIKADGAGARVRMLGISCTSTMGVEGAFRNWLTRAALVRVG